MTLLAVLTIALWSGISLVQSLFSTSGNIDNDVIVTAHRGGAGYGNENTLSCMKILLNKL